MSDYVTKKDMEKAFDDFAVKLFKYLDERFDKVDDRFEQQDKKMDTVWGAVDTLTKQTELYHQESMARDMQVSRLQGWLEMIAKKLDLKLEY